MSDCTIINSELVKMKTNNNKQKTLIHKPKKNEYEQKNL